MDEISARLDHARGRAAEKEALEGKLAALREQLEARSDALIDAEKRLRGEDDDVRALEGATLTALFASILGSKETRLSKERAEALAARLSRDACRESLERLEEDERALVARIAESGDADAELAAALAQKEAAVRAAGGDAARRLASIDAALADGRSAVKELTEASAAADGALDSLRRVESALDSARNWGTFDLLGGGMLATYAKHSRIDDARAAAHAAQLALDRFAREMADVRGLAGGALVVEIGGFATFADYFFDGLISDWVVQSRINDSRRNVETVIRQIEDARTRLASRADAVRREMGGLVEDRRRAVESA